MNAPKSQTISTQWLLKIFVVTSTTIIIALCARAIGHFIVIRHDIFDNILFPYQWFWKNELEPDSVTDHMYWCPAKVPLDSSHLPKPTIYFITPTYARQTQLCDLTRLGQMLRSVPNVLWILVEDAKVKSKAVAQLLVRSCVHHVHLTSNTSPNTKSLNKGNTARQKGIDWLRDKLKLDPEMQGVFYFGDDDNTYDLHLFHYMRQVKRVGIWPVALVTGGDIEMPIAENGTIVRWHTLNTIKKYNTDIAGFAVNVQWLKKVPQLKIDGNVPGNIENYMLEQLGLEPKELVVYGVEDKRALVWHTTTWAWPAFSQAKHIPFIV